MSAPQHIRKLQQVQHSTAVLVHPFTRPTQHAASQARRVLNHNISLDNAGARLFLGSKRTHAEMAAARTRLHAANCKYVLSRAQTRGIGLQVKHMDTVDLAPGNTNSKQCCWRCHDTLVSTTGYAQLMRRLQLVSTLTPHAVQQANLRSHNSTSKLNHTHSNPVACTGDRASAVQERSYRMLPAPSAGQALVLHSVA